jgi:hypothetical protein
MEYEFSALTEFVQWQGSGDVVNVQNSLAFQNSSAVYP